MIVLQLFVYTVASLGFAYVVGHSAISLPLRQWLAPATVAKCPLCGDEMPARFSDSVCNGPCTGPHHEDRVMVLYQPHNVGFWIVTLMECPACLGFWIGLFAGIIYYPTAFEAMAGAFYTAGSNFLLARLTGIMPDPSKEPEGAPPE